jgi:O-antigen/teichoic acid export membrane protein
MTPNAGPVRESVFYSVLDYVSQPAMMILAAPVLLRTLGVQQYGTWMLVNSIAATAAGLGGGFGDGATKYVSMYRGNADRHGAVRSLMAVLVVNCAFGALSALVLIVCAPWLIGHVFTIEASLRETGIVALRISAVLLVVRFAEAVFTSAVRGCERYRPMVLISVFARTMVIASAVVLAIKGYGLVPILWSTLILGIGSMVGQWYLAHTVLQASGLWRRVAISEGVREVFSFGAYTWLKSTLGVLIGYGDRLLVAGMLGTGPLAFYSLCNQLTQPIHALIGSAFNFIFPNFSALSASGRWLETRRNYRIAAGVAAAMVITICLIMIVGADLILRLWLGAAFATQYRNLLVAMIIGTGLLALTVVPHYAALAFGRSRALVLVNLAAGVMSMGCGYLLIQRFGLIGAGVAKIVVGVVFLSLFNIVRRALKAGGDNSRAESTAPESALNFAQ